MTLAAMINDNVFDQSYTKQIAYTDLENSFTVTADENGFYKFNLNTTIVLDPKNGQFKAMKLTNDMAWPLISYKIYGDTREAWMLMKINEVEFEDVFKPVKAGKTIRYLDTTQLQEVANIMSNL